MSKSMFKKIILVVTIILLLSTSFVINKGSSVEASDGQGNNSNSVIQQWIDF